MLAGVVCAGTAIWLTASVDDHREKDALAVELLAEESKKKAAGHDPRRLLIVCCMYSLSPRLKPAPLR